MNPEEVVARIHAAVASIDENMLQSVRASMIHRANVCLEVGGNTVCENRCGKYLVF